MEKAKILLRRIWRFVKPKTKIILFFVFLFSIFFLNTFHEEYPDEYDSLFGGRLINQGKIPYRDWFQHHQPGAYLLAALILRFSGLSFVRFRIILAFAFFLINTSGYFLVKKRLKKDKLDFYLVFLLLTALAGTYFWGQMLLADTLAAYLFIPGFTLLMVKEATKRKITSADLKLISLSTFLTWLTSMSFIYAVLGVNGYVFYRYLFGVHGRGKRLKRLKKYFQIFLVPYFVFFGFYAVSGGLDDYFFANIFYNSRYYIYNYPKPVGKPVNPLRYSVVILNAFINNFFPILTGVSAFSLGDPFNVTLAISLTALLFWLLAKKHYFFAALFGLVVVFATARVNPWTIKETDYQASMYILIALMSGSFALFRLKKNLDSSDWLPSLKILGTLVFATLSIYWVFNSFFLVTKFFQKVYPKYMGTASLIYDRPEITPILNRLVSPDDYAWVGPFDFKELFYLQTKIPTKYHWFLDHAARIDKIKVEMLADFSKNKPKVIVFRRYFHPWGGKAEDFNYFFTDFLDREYFRIFEYNQTLADKEYKWKIGNTRYYDLDGDFYFDNRYQQEIINQLLALDIIEAVPKEQEKKE